MEEDIATKRVYNDAAVCFSVVIFVVSCFCSVMLDDVGNEVENILSEE